MLSDDVGVFFIFYAERALTAMMPLRSRVISHDFDSFGSFQLGICLLWLFGARVRLDAEAKCITWIVERL